MDDAAAGGHPLHVTASEIAAVAHVILMQHVAVKHVGHGLETAVRMAGKAGDVIVRVLGAELVEHQERIEALELRAADAAAELHACAVGSGDGLDDALESACSHGMVILKSILC